MDLIKKLDLSLVRIESMIFIHGLENSDRLMGMIEPLTDQELLSTFGLNLHREEQDDYEILELILSHFSGHILARVSTPHTVYVNKNGVRKYIWDHIYTRLIVASTLADLVNRSSIWADSIREK